jgi:hypothetical protein
MLTQADPVRAKRVERKRTRRVVAARRCVADGAPATRRQNGIERTTSHGVEHGTKTMRRERSMGSRLAMIAMGIATMLVIGAAGSVLAPARARAEEKGIGLVKKTSGEVVIERGDERLAAAVGMSVFQKDRIVTGRDGAIGLTLADNAMLSAGPDSVLELETFRFDPRTHAGQLEVSLESGTLSAIAGKLVEANPESMKVRTPAAVLGVRGTEFAVRVEESAWSRFWKSLRFGSTGGGRDGMDPGTAASGSVE